MEPLFYAGSAFLLGALHGLEPGHGKTVMAAYLVGSRGTLRHAMLLGAVVTFTHTFSIILMGVLAVFAAAYFVPQQVEHALEAISGLLVTGVGAWLVYSRLLRAASPTHSDHSHTEGQRDSTTDESADGVSLGGLVAMGISGGMVPCPAALAMLLAAVTLGNSASGLAMVFVFSLGLAVILIGIGVGLVKAAGLMSRLFENNRRYAAWISGLSAVVVLALGVFLTAKAIGGILAS